jgi:hypothetical protein
MTVRGSKRAKEESTGKIAMMKCGKTCGQIGRYFVGKGKVVMDYG